MEVGARLTMILCSICNSIPAYVDVYYTILWSRPIVKLRRLLFGRRELRLILYAYHRIVLLAMFSCRIPVKSVPMFYMYVGIVIKRDREKK